YLHNSFLYCRKIELPKLPKNYLLNYLQNIVNTIGYRYILHKVVKVVDIIKGFKKLFIFIR
ncbi:MAG: hypothetical protein ACRC0G_01420, partial [Fusobacteriaceae bacterium]